MLSSAADEPRVILSQACRDLAPWWSECYCISDAIYYFDSKWGTIPGSVAQRTNNFGNIRSVPKDSPYEHTYIDTITNGWFAKFPDIRTGIYANTDLLVRRYAALDPETLTFRWARTKNPDYHDAVAKCYK